MTRVRFTIRVTPDLAEELRREAAMKERSVSDVVEDAIGRAMSGADGGVDRAVLLSRLEGLSRRLGVIERGLEALFELSAHATRFSMSVAPEISEADQGPLNARGAERFRNVVNAIVARLSKGRSVWRDQFTAPPSAVPNPPNQEVAAE